MGNNLSLELFRCVVEHTPLISIDLIAQQNGKNPFKEKKNQLFTNLNFVFDYLWYTFFQKPRNLYEQKIW